MIIDESVYLEHYGKKGMRWGVINEEKTTERREAKAKKHEEKAEGFQKDLDNLNATTPTTNRQKRLLREQKQELTENKDQALKDAAAKREGKLTDHQRKVAIGAGVAAGIIVSYGAYTMLQSGEVNRLGLKGQALLKGESPWKVKESLSGPMNSTDILNNVVKQVNPGYGDMGTKVNCRRCTFAYEMRRRGFDVAATKTTNSRGQDISGLLNATNPGGDRIKSGPFGIATEVAQEHWRKGMGKIDETPLTDALTNGLAMGKNKIDGVGEVSYSVFDTLKGQPNGSRGELGVIWGVGGGHSMAYEIIGGKPHIFDAQSGKRYTNGSQMLEDFGMAGGIREAAFTRLDNIPLNEDFLMRWLKSA